MISEQSGVWSAQVNCPNGARESSRVLIVYCGYGTSASAHRGCFICRDRLYDSFVSWLVTA
jgi:hypothetical protein